MASSLKKQRHGPIRDRWRPWLACAVCTIAYLYAAPLFPAINNPNENVRFYMTAALVEEGSYEISTMRQRWGWTNDAAELDGRYFSVKAPGTSFVGLPGYALARWLSERGLLSWHRDTALWLCRVTATTIPSLLFLLFLFQFLGRHVPVPWIRDCVFYAVALGSNFYGYSLNFVSHSTSAALAFFAFANLFESKLGRPMGPGRAIATGLGAAGVTFFEYPGLIISVVLSGYALVTLKRRHLLWFMLGAVIPTLAMMHFQNAAFGSPFKPGHLHVENPAFRSVHEQGFFGANALHLDALGGLLFSPAYGLFPLTPVLAFSAFGFFRMFRERRTRHAATVLLLCTSLTALAIATMLHWRGGWTIGPRYLVALVPLLAWPSACGLLAIEARFPRFAMGLAFALLAVSLVASGLPSAYYPHVPESFTRPLPELFFPLLRLGYAPLNLGQWFGLQGLASMAPWALAMIAPLVVLAKTRPTWSGRSVLTAALILGGFALLLGVPQRSDPPAVLTLVMDRWHPPHGPQATEQGLTR